MCGISCFISKNEACSPYVLHGIQILQSRGYDAVGMASIDSKNELVICKYASGESTNDCIEVLKKNAPLIHKTNKVGIAHSRWATSSRANCMENAHPFTDDKNRIALVHNGIIENYTELRKEIESKYNITFRSETDSEVVAQLIGTFLDENQDILSAVKNAISRIHGTYGLAILHKDSPDQIIVCRNGSPINIGISKDCMFIASETSAFNKFTKKYICLKDGETVVVKSTSLSIVEESRIEISKEESGECTPYPFNHWLEKEIFEQPCSMSRTLNEGARLGSDNIIRLGGLDNAKSLMLDIKNLVLSACGTSLYAAMYGQKIFQQLRCFDSVTCIDAGELYCESLPRHDVGLLVLSQSGETKDLHRAVLLAQENNITTFSVINKVGSLIAKTTNCGVYLNAGLEFSVASTKAFSSQVIVISLLSAWYNQYREPTSNIHNQKRLELLDNLRRLPLLTEIALETRSQCKELALKLVNKTGMFILGKHYAESVAMEAALKIKEICGIFSQGYSMSALKHGPFALIEPGFVVILFIFDDIHQGIGKITLQEVKCRGAYTIVITDKREIGSEADEIIVIPSNGILTGVLSIIPIQLLAYEIAVLKGVNPDFPKNLAKCCSVD